VIPVRLTIEDYDRAVAVGMRRMVTSQRRGDNHASTYQRTWLERTREETIGACGELAFCKAYDIAWPESVDTFHHIPDVAGVEIRACHRDGACLIIRDNDDDDRWYYLITGEPPEMMIRGCIRGRDAKRDAWVRDPHGHRRAWFVPQEALHAVAARNGGREQ